jgi:hypothetical protein
MVNLGCQLDWTEIPRQPVQHHFWIGWEGRSWRLNQWTGLTIHVGDTIQSTGLGIEQTDRGYMDLLPPLSWDTLLSCPWASKCPCLWP